MTEGSLFAGIGGFTEGFHRAGFDCKWLVEIEPFCQAVLKSRFPKAELFADVKTCGKNLTAVDVLTAGFPCQDLSVAGKRAGLAGAQSGLFWEVVRILGELRPPWFVLENVPGLFSSNSGRDFGVVLNALDELGYGLAWRVLDSRYFRVAQRRRRVFIVGRFGKPCSQEILFESEGSAGDFAESGETGTGVASEIAVGINGSGLRGVQPGSAATLAYGIYDEQTPKIGHDIMPALRNREHGGGIMQFCAHERAPSDAHGMRDFTGLPIGLDSARYRALGNAVTVNVAQWIAERIKWAEQTKLQEK